PYGTFSAGYSYGNDSSQYNYGVTGGVVIHWICPYISRHLLSLNPLQARCRRYSRGER
ncbi:fimbria/pilus outer membrane usher protein, partial [Escherichia coli]|nr:fimbria/pilus outer membrane usher protein [Escherichia coli]